MIQTNLAAATPHSPNTSPRGLRQTLASVWRNAVGLGLGLAGITAAAQSDLSFPPTSSGGHDFNHSPIGQTFVAPTANVQAGIYLADETTYTEWLATLYPGQILPGSFPYAVAPSVTVQIELLDGAGTGPVLHSVQRTLTVPFSDFVDVDYAAAGVSLTVGGTYTLRLTDLSGQTYPQNVTGWIVPSVTDTTSGAGQPLTDGSGNVVGYLPYGAYAEGQPILQGSLVTNDAGIGDNAFHVVASLSTPPDQIIRGSNAVITAYVARNPGFIVINGGLELNDHLWTTNLNPGNTTFLGGLVNWFQTGLLVDYTGIATSQGVLLTHLTVKPAPTPLVIDALLPAGTVGTAYLGSFSVSGGVAPYTVFVDGLPGGLAATDSTVSGIPSVAGDFGVTIQVTDALGSASVAALILSVKPPAANYTIRDEGKAKITAVGSNYLMVGAKKLLWNAQTVIQVNTPSGKRSVIDAFVKAGMKIQWKGLRDATTGAVMTSRLEIN